MLTLKELNMLLSIHCLELMFKIKGIMHDASSDVPEQR